MKRAFNQVLLSIAVTAAPLLIAGCRGSSAHSPAGAAPAAASAAPPAPKVAMHKKGEDIFAGAKLFVDQEHQVRKLADSMKSKDPVKAAALEQIAEQPAVEWLGGWNANIEWAG